MQQENEEYIEYISGRMITLTLFKNVTKMTLHTIMSAFMINRTLGFSKEREDGGFADTSQTRALIHTTLVIFCYSSMLILRFTL